MTNNPINKYYLNQITAIKSSLKKEHVVQLQEFLDKESYYKLLSELKKLKPKEDVDVFDHKYKSIKFNIPKDISSFIKKLLDKDLKFELIILSHGDYGLINNKKIEAIIDLTEGWHNAWGGYAMFNDGEGNVIKIQSKENSITLSNGKTFSAIKYVNNHSENNKKIYLIGR